MAKGSARWTTGISLRVNTGANLLSPPLVAPTGSPTPSFWFDLGLAVDFYSSRCTDIPLHSTVLGDLSVNLGERFSNRPSAVSPIWRPYCARIQGGWYPTFYEEISDECRSYLSPKVHFATDGEVAPLQASDMFAWHHRRHILGTLNDKDKMGWLMLSKRLNSVVVESGNLASMAMQLGVVA